MTKTRLDAEDRAPLIDAINRTLADEASLKPHLAIVRAGERLTNRLSIDADQGWFRPMLGDLLRQGVSVIVNDLAITDEVAEVVARRTGLPAPWITQQNLYVTPRESQGFDPHCDPHIVVVAHLYGRKDWTIYRRTDDNPVYADDTTTIAPKSETLPVLTRIAVEPGDMFVIPRGVYHSAVATSAASVHLAISAVGVKALDYVWAMAQRALADSDMRADLDAESALARARDFIAAYEFSPAALPHFARAEPHEARAGEELAFQGVLDAL